MIDLTKKIEQETGKYMNDPVVLMGSSSAFSKALEKAFGYAESDETLLIYGEIGTGKTDVSKAIHCLSPRRQFPFRYFDCGLSHETLIETELFGHRRGAFTGALEHRTGLIEEADKGTFLLDEIADFPLSLQPKLLRVAQEKEIKKIGENRVIKLDIRFIGATHKDLKIGVKENWFREDLYSRLNVLTLVIPPLRERGDDLVELVDYRLFLLNQKYSARKKISFEVFQYLAAYSWPQNVRELNNAITTAYFNSKDVIFIEAFPYEIRECVSDKNYSIEDSLPNLRFLFDQLVAGKKNFWMDVHDPYLNRDLTRSNVRTLIKIGLQRNGRKYKTLCNLFNCDYDKFMGFLRHHNLKPNKMEW